MTQKHTLPRSRKRTASSRSANLPLSIRHASAVLVFLLHPGAPPPRTGSRTGTGLGVSKARVAVADFAAKIPRRSLLPTDSARWFAPTSITAASWNSSARASTRCRCPARRRKSITKPGPRSGDRAISGLRKSLDATERPWKFRPGSTTCAISTLPPVIGKVYRGEATDDAGAHFRAPVRRRNHQQTVGRPAGNRQHADRVRQQPQRQQGNLGHGLRR